MQKCAKCQAENKQWKSGFTGSGSQRYQCQVCGHRYTPKAKEHGYPQSVRGAAIKLYVDGMNFRRIARQLGVNHQSVINWINAYIDSLPEQIPQPQRVTTIEMDELFSFVGNKKTKSTS